MGNAGAPIGRLFLRGFSAKSAVVGNTEQAAGL